MIWGDCMLCASLCQAKMMDDISCIICNTIRSFLAHSCFWTFHLGQRSLPMSSPVLKDLYQLPHNFYCSNWNAFRSEKRWAVFKVRNKSGRFVLLGFLMLFYFIWINVYMGEPRRKFGGEFSNYEEGKSLDCAVNMHFLHLPGVLLLKTAVSSSMGSWKKMTLHCSVTWTSSYWHVPICFLPLFFRLNISFAMGLTKNVCLLQPNSQRRKHWRYVQSSRVNIGWL